MPIFEYSCKTCQHEFEALVFGDEKASCPKCHGKSLAAKLSVFAVAAKGASASVCRALRILWRSPRAGRLLHA